MSQETLLKSNEFTESSISDKKPANKNHAIILYLFSGAIVCVNLLSSKLLYERNPELNGAVLLVYRGALTSLLLAGYHNVHLKNLMYE